MANERPKLVSFWFKLNHWITRRIHIVNVPVSDKGVIRMAWTGHLLAFAYSEQYLRYRAQRLVPWSNATTWIFWIQVSNTKNQGTQQRKQCIACIQWPHEKIDVRIKGADSSSSSGELGRCLECFLARNIIPTEQSVPASTSPHSAG